MIKKNIPKGFQEGMGYGMVGYVVTHSKYPLAGAFHRWHRLFLTCHPGLPSQADNLGEQRNEAYKAAKHAERCLVYQRGV